MWMHPTRRLKIGSHVDDCILRGERKHHTGFWTEAKKRFNIKHWDFVEVDQQKMFCYNSANQFRNKLIAMV